MIVLLDVKGYRKESEKGRLPFALRKRKHSVMWPLHPKTEVKRLDFFDPKCFIPHSAIDLELDIGTKIIAPELVKVVKVEQHEIYGHQAAVSCYGLDSRILYTFAHLDMSRLPEEIHKKKIDPNLDVYVKRENPVGEVAEYCISRFCTMCKGGRPPSHLHLITAYRRTCPDDGPKFYAAKNAFNPLLILEKLCCE